MAETRPTATFLLSPETGRELTFKGLQEQAVLLVERFRRMGLERGDKVAFLLDNGLFTAQLFLGAMYGGFVWAAQKWCLCEPGFYPSFVPAVFAANACLLNAWSESPNLVRHQLEMSFT
jgi:non-ribosomal peptide synthetase component F